MENMDVSKVEDFALATVLDPRFKWLDFPHLDQWLDGTLTKEMVLAWLRGAWYDPVKQWIPAIVAIPNEGTSATAVSPEDADATRGKRKRGLFGCMVPIGRSDGWGDGNPYDGPEAAVSCLATAALPHHRRA
jgi:hypothetical protein